MSLQLFQYDAPIPKLINELKLYGYKTTPSENVLYGAPEGYHDDCAIALALAAWQLKRSPPAGIGVGFVQHDEYNKKGNISEYPAFSLKQAISKSLKN
jgi:hypothetical protein